MKWLVTRSASRQTDEHYRNWLARLSIEAKFVAPRGWYPAALGSYSALLLTGGGDVDPTFYGEKRAEQTDGINLARDQMEIELIRVFLLSGKALLGVCRGMQVLNVALRGRLIQDIPVHLARNASATSEQHAKVNGQDSFHSVKPVAETRLAASLGAINKVNSSHHQALDPAYLGNNLRVAAVSEAGVIEAVEGMEERPGILAVQWHPERMDFQNPASSGLLRYMQEIAALSSH